MRRIFALALVSGALTVTTGAAAVPLTVDGAQRFQVIDGFGVSANSASWDGGELRPAIDALLSAGVSIFRVVIEMTDWESTNDNADPAVFDWTYYNQVYSSPKFEELWSTISYLNSKGVRDRLMLNFMGRLPPWMGGADLGAAMIDEWVETTASVAYYGRVTRGLSFGLFSPSNEIDWDGVEGPRISPADYATALRKLSQKLDALGLSDLKLVAPDTAQLGQGTGPYRSALMAEPLVMQKLAALALHDYSGNTGNARDVLDNSPFPLLPFWMTELSLFENALSSVAQSASAVLVWDGYDSVYQHAILAGRGTTPPNDAGNGPALLSYDTVTRRYSPRKVYYEFSHLSRFVPRGSQRIAALENDANLTVVAFRGPTTGALTIVGRNGGPTSISVDGTLSQISAPTSFSHYRTNASLDLARQGDVPVSNSRFSFVVPANTVFTLSATGPAKAVPALGRKKHRAGYLTLFAAALGLIALRRTTTKAKPARAD